MNEHTNERDLRAEREQRDLASMRASGELSEAAADDLERRMRAGEDAYPYRSVTGRPFLWVAGTRFTPASYGAWLAAGSPEPAGFWELHYEQAQARRRGEGGEA